MSDKELAFVDQNNKMAHIMSLWSAKEALFKISPLYAFDFKKDMEIQPFKLKEVGSFNGKIVKGNIVENYRLNYFFVENNIIVWCVK